MIYPAMTYIGSNKFSALYGQNDTIIDQKATGLQHLYVDNYEKDLIHTACSTVKVDDVIYFADRIKPKVGHPKRHKSRKSYVENYSIMVDEFEYTSFTKVDKVAAHENYVRFQTTITNTTNENKEFQLSSLLITKPENKTNIQSKKDILYYEIEGKHISVVTSSYKGHHLSLDAPSAFMYRGIEDLLFNRNNNVKELKNTLPIASSIYTNITIKPQESYTFDWAILIGNSAAELEASSSAFEFEQEFNDVKEYWNNYLENVNKPTSYEYETKTKLVALKGALLDGLLPADLTGHYFANGEVCFYSRDALMGSRAFLYAGLYEDFLSIINFLLSCNKKDNGEYYQRYRFDKIQDEGANNNVFTQIDFIGYFTRVITDYYHLTGTLACTFEVIDEMISILNNTSQKNGLYGPEGGVNEGVFGPAFITSTNMFIAGGIKGAVYLAGNFNEYDLEQKWSFIYKKLFLSLESVFDKEYYPYGYVTYHDDIVRKYDTPQLLSGSLGYPITKQFKQNLTTLIQKASYFDFGIGYSEQEYHDGPWIFNTAAAAQVSYLTENITQYNEIMKWMIHHQNGFLMNPEAIDAKNEGIPFINPLMWANSEFVCAAFSNIITEMRRKS